MSKSALIKIRCSEELKTRLEALANAREQSLSDYVRTRLVENMKLEEDHTPYGVCPSRVELAAAAGAGAKSGKRALSKGGKRKTLPPRTRSAQGSGDAAGS